MRRLCDDVFSSKRDILTGYREFMHKVEDTGRVVRVLVKKRLMHAHMPVSRFGVPYQEADVVLLCAETATNLQNLDFWQNKCLGYRGASMDPPHFIVVMTKVDLLASNTLKRGEARRRKTLWKMKRAIEFPVVEFSALSGTGRDELKEEIVSICAREARRIRAVEEAVRCLREMHLESRACFGGVQLPRDIVEYCLIAALENTSGDPAWNSVRVAKKDTKMQEPNCQKVIACMLLIMVFLAGFAFVLC